MANLFFCCKSSPPNPHESLCHGEEQEDSESKLRIMISLLEQALFAQISLLVQHWLYAFTILENTFAEIIGKKD